jgi:hypothetical protein
MFTLWFNTLIVANWLVVELGLATPVQFPLHVQTTTISEPSRCGFYSVVQIPTQEPRKLRGRFLHITDMHPDPYYVPKTAESTACHRKRKKKKKNIAGFYGTPYSYVL